ncbi:RluA family pseudouridine synthase [Chroococcidiopsis sp.]|uniref:RluA family pseudouridine synthase n=1 Tax=Chroococcidiopsis sp. TaxID=3088168 RepID=UPI003F2DE846
MMTLHLITDFIGLDYVAGDSPVSYWYEGYCPQTGKLLTLPRTPFVEAIASGLRQQLATDARYSHEGKMYGVLLVETAAGEQRVLKAFSGLLHGRSTVAGWVGAIEGKELALEEARTLDMLAAMKQELIALQQIPERQEYATLVQDFETRWQQLTILHRDRKQQRQSQRQVFQDTLAGVALVEVLAQLDEQSRQDGIDRKLFKRQRDRLLQPLQQAIEQADKRTHELKQQRKSLSRQLQALMHASYRLSNFAGESLPLQQLMAGSLPTGTGACCAPKLLHYAATHDLKPLAMAEFWWGSPSTNGEKVQGEFYGACAERCQPLMGFLLSGLQRRSPQPPLQRGAMRSPHPPEDRGAIRSPQPPLQRGAKNGFVSPFSRRIKGDLQDLCIQTKESILYEDEWLIAVNKPPGLLSVPGRYSDRYDSVVSRLRYLLPDGMAIAASHRLDLETSGILLLTRDRASYRHLSQQFQQRRVRKVYEAVLAGCVRQESGTIQLPLWGDPSDRPYQKIDARGKPSLTEFQVIARSKDSTRIQFFPLTGRTHQLRVHAADSRGLGIPILGDRLYGCRAQVERLHLHARELCFEHPYSGKSISLYAETPF